VLSFEDDSSLFDLNKDWSLADWSQFHNAFDLVLCEQVLEHCLHPDRAIKNLGHILKPGGLLHISVPAINNSHGEPFYFYAGFPPATLREFAQESGLTVFECDSWTSNKASRMYATCDWAPISHSGSLAHMILGLWSQRKSYAGLSSIFLGKVRNFLTYPCQGLFRHSRQANSVVTWMFAGKETVN
jgi:SAM-dependent methyltransferase